MGEEYYNPDLEIWNGIETFDPIQDKIKKAKTGKERAEALEIQRQLGEKESDPAKGFFSQFGDSFMLGGAQTIGNIASTLGADDLSKGMRDYVSEHPEKQVNPEATAFTKAGGYGGDAASTTLPSVLVGTALQMVGAPGWLVVAGQYATTFAQEYGGAKQEYLDAGLSEEDARNYAIVEAGLNSAIEIAPWGDVGNIRKAMSGMTQAGRKQAIKMATAETIARYKRMYPKTWGAYIGKFAKNLAGQMGGEGFEETLQGRVTDVMHNVSGIKDGYYGVEQDIQNFTGGALGTLFSGAGVMGAGVESRYNAQKGVQRINAQQGYVEDLEKRGMNASAGLQKAPRPVYSWEAAPKSETEQGQEGGPTQQRINDVQNGVIHEAGEGEEGVTEDGIYWKKDSATTATVSTSDKVIADFDRRNMKKTLETPEIETIDKEGVLHQKMSNGVEVTGRSVKELKENALREVLDALVRDGAEKRKGKVDGILYEKDGGTITVKTQMRNGGATIGFRLENGKLQKTFDNGTRQSVSEGVDYVPQKQEKAAPSIPEGFVGIKDGKYFKVGKGGSINIQNNDVALEDGTALKKAFDGKENDGSFVDEDGTTYYFHKEGGAMYWTNDKGKYDAAFVGGTQEQASPAMDREKTVGKVNRHFSGTVDQESSKAVSGLMRDDLGGVQAPENIRVFVPKSKAMKALVAVGEKIGVKVRFFSDITFGGTADNYNGIFGKAGEVWLNVNHSVDSPMFVIGHEWGHNLKKRSPKLYRELQATLKEYLSEQKDADGKSVIDKELERLGKAYGREANSRYISEEFICDRIGDVFGDVRFWERYANRTAETGGIKALRELKQLLADFISAVKNAFKGFEKNESASRFLTNLDKAFDAVTKAIEDHAEQLEGKRKMEESSAIGEEQSNMGAQESAAATRQYEREEGVRVDNRNKATASAIGEERAENDQRESYADRQQYAREEALRRENARLKEELRRRDLEKARQAGEDQAAENEAETLRNESQYATEQEQRDADSEATAREEQRYREMKAERERKLREAADQAKREKEQRRRTNAENEAKRESDDYENEILRREGVRREEGQRELNERAQAESERQRDAEQRTAAEMRGFEEPEETQNETVTGVNVPVSKNTNSYFWIHNGDFNENGRRGKYKKKEYLPPLMKKLETLKEKNKIQKNKYADNAISNAEDAIEDDCLWIANQNLNWGFDSLYGYHFDANEANLKRLGYEYADEDSLTDMDEDDIYTYDNQYDEFGELLPISEKDKVLLDKASKQAIKRGFAKKIENDTSVSEKKDSQVSVDESNGSNESNESNVKSEVVTENDRTDTPKKEKTKRKKKEKTEDIYRKRIEERPIDAKNLIGKFSGGTVIHSAKGNVYQEKFDAEALSNMGVINPAVEHKDNFSVKKNRFGALQTALEPSRSGKYDIDRYKYIHVKDGVAYAISPTSVVSFDAPKKADGIYSSNGARIGGIVDELTKQHLGKLDSLYGKDVKQLFPITPDILSKIAVIDIIDSTPGCNALINIDGRWFNPRRLYRLLKAMSETGADMSKTTLYGGKNRNSTICLVCEDVRAISTVLLSDGDIKLNQDKDTNLRFVDNGGVLELDTHDVSEADENGTRASLVRDKATIDRLESDGHYTAYRMMQIGPDGKLHSPMAGVIDGKWGEATELGKWEQSDERPDSRKYKVETRNGQRVSGIYSKAMVPGETYAMDKNGEYSYYFPLTKNEGDSGIHARYNPYIHASPIMLNDQFATAYKRPELVVVEVQVPRSEIDGDNRYHAQYAKDSTGLMDWKSGAVASQLDEGSKRQVYLSRYDKPVRIVPNAEVAEHIVNLFNGKEFTVPANTMTPAVLRELEKYPNVNIDYSKVEGKQQASMPMWYRDGMDTAVSDRIREGRYDEPKASLASKKFISYFGDWKNHPETASKVVDKDGKPLVVYHDTNAKIFVNKDTGEVWDELDWKEKEKWESSDDWDEYWKEQDFYTFSRLRARRSIEYPGFFFSPVQDPHSEYGKRRIAAYLNIRHPAIDPTIEDAGVTDNAGEVAMKKLIDQGYDGIFRTDGKGNVIEYIAFYPEQIKSATDNVGTFDKDNPDIRYSLYKPVTSGSSAETDALGYQIEDEPRYNLATEATVADKARKWAKTSEAKKLGMTPEKCERILNETELAWKAIHDQLDDKEYQEFSKLNPTVSVDWRDGKEKPVMTWHRGNQEYKYDMSSGLLCINNDGLEMMLASPAMVDIMHAIEKGEKGYTSEDYLRLYKTLRDNGEVVPCKGCFDFAPRGKMLASVSQKFANELNGYIDERNRDPKAFDESVKAINTTANPSPVNGVPVFSKSKSDMMRIAVSAEKLKKHFDWTVFMSADGQSRLVETNPSVMRAWERLGAGKPKDKFKPIPYDGVIIARTNTIISGLKSNDKTPSFRAMYVNIGTSLRRNSHDEMRMTNWYDEFQFVRDCWMKGLMVFKYVKNPDDVRLFGNTGIKFNMSVFPAFVPGGVAAGLDANGDFAFAEESIGGREFPYMKEGVKHYDGKKGFEMMKAYQNKDVSFSTVIFSFPHMIKFFVFAATSRRNPHGWGGSAIPFHAGGATDSQLESQGLGKCVAVNPTDDFTKSFTNFAQGVTNFEQIQNDRFSSNWIFNAGDNKGKSASNHKIEFETCKEYYNQKTGMHLKRSVYTLDSEGNKIEHKWLMDYNDECRKDGTDYCYKDVADRIMAHLRSLDLIPRFEVAVPEEHFVNWCKLLNVDPKHPALGWKGEGHTWSPTDSEVYYTLMCDYGMTNLKDGKYSPQRPVMEGREHFYLPANTIDVIKAGLKRESGDKAATESRKSFLTVAYLNDCIRDGALTQKQANAIIRKHHLESEDNINDPKASIYIRANPIVNDQMLRDDVDRVFANYVFAESKTNAEAQDLAARMIEDLGGFDKFHRALQHGKKLPPGSVGVFALRALENSTYFLNLPKDQRDKVLEDRHAYIGSIAGQTLQAFRESQFDATTAANVQASINNYLKVFPDERIMAIQRFIENKYGIDIMTTLPSNIIQDREKLDSMLRDIITHGDSFWRMLPSRMTEMWMNFILSGVKTHVVNTASNLGQAIYEFGPKRITEATLNGLLGMTGHRIKSGATWGEYTTMLEHVDWKKAWKDAKDAFNLEVVDSDMGKMDARFLPKIPGTFGRIIRTPSRLLKAADILIRSVVAPMETAAYAYRIGKAQGLTGTNLKNFVKAQFLQGNAQSDAQLYGARRAREFTFTEDIPGENRIDQSILRQINKWKEDGGFQGWLVNTLFPFVKTPYNILRQGVRKGHLGALNLAYQTEEALRGKRKFDDEYLKILAEQVICWALTGMFFYGEDDDDEPVITGEYEERRGGRGAWERQNIPAKSIRIGGTWYDYSRIEPLSHVLSAIGNVVHARRSDDPKAYMKAFIQTGKSMADKSYFQTAREIMDLISADEYTMKNVGANYISSWIPNVARQFMLYSDDYVRETRGADFFDLVRTRSGERVLCPKVDYYGRDIERDANVTGSSWLWRFAPVSSKPADYGDMADELLRNYNMQNPDNAYFPSIASRKYKNKAGETVDMTGEEFYLFSQKSGQLAHKKILEGIRRGYINANRPTEKDIELVKKIFARAKKETREKMFRGR